MNYLLLEPTKERGTAGLINFSLSIRNEAKLTTAGSWIVNSGAPDKQILTRYDGKDSYSGDMKPIPEGEYNVGQLEFKGGKFDWVDSWGPGLGDLWVSITFYHGEYNRKAFGFHLDENRGWAPGSAGCIVFRSKADAESWVEAMRKYDPKILYVNYGLGFVDLPTKKAPLPAPKNPAVELERWTNKNGSTIRVSTVLNPGVLYDVFETPGQPMKLVQRS